MCVCKAVGLSTLHCVMMFGWTSAWLLLLCVHVRVYNRATLCSTNEYKHGCCQ